MSEIIQGDENHLIETHDEGGLEQAVPSDDEDDYEGYFLEPVGINVNIADKIAEANKKLLEEEEEEIKEGTRPRKVQFSEDLVNYEPNYYSDDDCTESVQDSVISDKDLELKPSHEDTNSQTTNEPVPSSKVEEKSDLEKLGESIPEEITEELDSGIVSISNDLVDGLNEESSKFILVLLPKEQNSSCESLIGEEIEEEKPRVDEKELKPLPEKTVKPKITRPKSAKKSCEVSKISPHLNCSSNAERKSWQNSSSSFIRARTKAEGSEKKGMLVGEIKVQIKERLLKKINIDDSNLDDLPSVITTRKCADSRPKSYYNEKISGGSKNRPKTAPITRNCCVIKTELPNYNGLRSEYGLSAEQLEERKQKALENKQKKKQEQLKKRQEEIRKSNENEQTFQKWLFNKTKKSLKKKPLKLTDTLSRSDVYIQTHASYATNRDYCLNYSNNDKSKNKRKETRGKRNKAIIVEKLLDNMTPHFKRSFNIYLGVKPKFV